MDGEVDIGIGSDSDNSETIIDSESGINSIRNDHGVLLLLTNAHLLKPKIPSLKDAFSSFVLDVACITETWYKGGRCLAKHLQEIEASSGICIFHKSRDGRGKRSGGGVTIAFDLTSCNLKRRALKHMDKNIEVI